MTPTEKRILAALPKNGDWVGWIALRRQFSGRGNGWFMRGLTRLSKDGVIERRVDTLTSNREPGWLRDELTKRFSDPWSEMATDFAYSYRRKNKGGWRHEA